MAEERVIVIKGDAKNAQKAFDDLGKTIQEQKDITIEFEEELVRLEKQLKETGKASFNPQRASLKKQIDSIKDSIKDQRVSLKNLNNERSKARSLMSNITDGIKRQSIVVRTLNRYTGGLASEFIRLAKAAKLGGKAMRTALIVSGIGIAIALVGLLVEHWDTISKFVGITNDKLEKQLEHLDKDVYLTNVKLNLLREQEKTLILQGKSTASNRKEQLRLLETLSLQGLEQVNVLKTQLEQEKSKARELSLWQKIFSISSDPTAFSDEEKKRFKELQKQIDDSILEIEKLRKKIIELSKPVKDKYIEEAIKDEISRLDAIEKIVESYRIKNQDLEDVLFLEKLERQKSRALIELDLLNATEEEKHQLKKYYDGLITDEKNKILAEHQSNLDEESEKESLREAKKEDKRLKALYDEGVLNEKVEDAKRDQLNKTAGLLIGLAGKSTKLGKALATADIIRSGYKGVQNAFTTAQDTPMAKINPAYPFIQAGLAGAFSALQLKNLLSEKPPSGSGGGQQQNISAPSFNLVQGTGSNQIANSIRTGQPPIEAFILASSVSTSEQLARNKIVQSSI